MKSIFNILIPTLILAACAQPEVNTEEEEESTELAEVIETQDSTSSNDIACTGDISVPADAWTSIHSPVKGILKSIKVLEGEKVRKGQLLGTLEHIDIIKIQEDYLKSKIQYDFWKSEYERKTTLYNEGVIPKKEFQEVEASYLSEGAMFESLRKQVQFLGLSESRLKEGKISRSISITSPINGYVTGVHGNSGMFADQDTKIFSLVDDSHKHVHLNVFASDIGKVEEGQSIVFRVAGSDKEYKAKVYLIGKSVELENKSIHVHGHLESEEEDLIIGSVVFGKILID